MRLQWRQDGAGVYILQSYVGLTVDGKEVWADVPKALKPEKPVKVQPCCPEAPHHDSFKPTPPQPSEREKVVDKLAGVLSEYEGESWFKVAEAALEYLEGRMPSPISMGMSDKHGDFMYNKGRLEALADVRREVFGKP